MLTQQIIDSSTGEIKSSRNLGENTNFVMLFRNEIQNLIGLGKSDGKALAIFMFLTEHMDTNNAIIVSRDTISEALDISLPTVDRKIKFLKKNNFIETHRTGAACIYTVNANIVWTTYANKKDYASFKATVLISRSEQSFNIKKSTIKKVDLST